MFDSYADIFAERAGMYHHAMASFPLARQAEFEAMVSPLLGRDVSSLCDLPSGGGYLADHLPPEWKYTAIEPTESFAALCRMRDGQELVRSSLTSVPRPDCSFDAVISLAGLHHEQDKAAIIREAARLLRPGGSAVIADVAAGSSEDRFLNGFVDSNSKLGHRGEFLDGGFASLVEDSGLRVDSDEMVATPWQFENRSDAASFAQSLFGISAPVEQVADAVESILGVDDSKPGFALRWKLRRLVCTRACEEAG